MCAAVLQVSSEQPISVTEGTNITIAALAPDKSTAMQLSDAIRYAVRVHTFSCGVALTSLSFPLCYRSINNASLAREVQQSLLPLLPGVCGIQAPQSVSAYFDGTMC